MHLAVNSNFSFNLCRLFKCDFKVKNLFFVFCSVIHQYRGLTALERVLSIEGNIVPHTCPKVSPTARDTSFSTRQRRFQPGYHRVKGAQQTPGDTVETSLKASLPS